MKKVSVIVPIYQVETYIERCLDSILRQTYSCFEIICVDDCGKDNSMEIVRAYENQYPQKICITGGKQNQGLGAAREEGMRVATGEYICFVDSDDYLEADYIEQYMKGIVADTQKNPDLIVGGFVRDSAKGQRHMAIDIHDRDYLWVYPNAWAKVYRREFLLKHGLDFRGIRRYEDEWFNYRILMENPCIKCLTYEGYHYCENPTSITRSKKVDRTQAFAEYAGITVNFVKENLISIKNNELLAYSIASALTANLLFNARGCGIKKMNEAVTRYDEVLHLLPERIEHNRYIKLSKLRREPSLKRYATWLVMRFKQIHIDKLLFWIDAVI